MTDIVSFPVCYKNGNGSIYLDKSIYKEIITVMTTITHDINKSLTLNSILYKKKFEVTYEIHGGAIRCAILNALVKMNKIKKDSFDKFLDVNDYDILVFCEDIREVYITYTSILNMIHLNNKRYEYMEEEALKKMNNISNIKKHPTVFRFNLKLNNGKKVKIDLTLGLKEQILNMPLDFGFNSLSFKFEPKPQHPQKLYISNQHNTLNNTFESYEKFIKGEPIEFLMIKHINNAIKNKKYKTVLLSLSRIAKFIERCSQKFSNIELIKLDDKNECPICYNEGVDIEYIEQLQKRGIVYAKEICNYGITLKCGHMYDLKCLMKYFEKKNNDEIACCPMCRQEIVFNETIQENKNIVPETFLNIELDDDMKNLYEENKTECRSPTTLEQIRNLFATFNDFNDLNENDNNIILDIENLRTDFS